MHHISSVPTPFVEKMVPAMTLFRIPENDQELDVPAPCHYVP